MTETLRKLHLSPCQIRSQTRRRLSRGADVHTNDFGAYVLLGRSVVARGSYGRCVMSDKRCDFKNNTQNRSNRRSDYSVVDNVN